MAVNPNNICQGPAVLWWNAYGATEPPDTNTAITQPPYVTGSPNYTDLGGTTGGVTVMVSQMYGQIKVDQLVDPIGARMTGRTIQVTFGLMEASLQNLYIAMNQAATTNVLTG